MIVRGSDGQGQFRRVGIEQPVGMGLTEAEWRALSNDERRMAIRWALMPLAQRERVIKDYAALRTILRLTRA